MSEADLRHDTRTLKVELKEKELAHEDYMRSLKRDHDRAITSLRLDFERQAKEMQARYDDRTKKLRDGLEVARKVCCARAYTLHRAHSDVSSHCLGVACAGGHPAHR